MEKKRAKIADFGQVTDSNRKSTLTAGQGTKLYMAPEMLFDDYTSKVDIYR